MRKPAIQCGLVVALLAALTYGMLTPAGGARATGQGASGTPGTPVAAETRVPPVVRASPAPGTPLPTDPDKAATAAPVASAPATPQVATPTVATRPGPPATPVATPTVSPATVALATPLTATPTRPPGGTVSAAIVRDMSPLAFTLNGREQVAQTTLAVAVTDTAPADRQPGWSLALTIEQFRVADNPARALPMGAVTLLGVTVACVGDTDCTMPQNTVAYPRTMPAGAAVRIATAAPGSGSGQFVVTATFAVRVPAIAYAGSYATRLAVAVAGGAPVLVAQPQGASPTTATAPAAPPPPTGTGTASPPPSPAPVRQTPTSTAPAAPAATPTPASTPEPVVTPEPTVAPAPEPVVTPEPVVVPAPEPTPEATAPAPVAAFPASDRIGTTQAVNLRTGPGVAHASRGHLPQGTSLAATGETRVVAGILWRRFTLADGRTGWVRDIDVLPVAR